MVRSDAGANGRYWGAACAVATMLVVLHLPTGIALAGTCPGTTVQERTEQLIEAIFAPAAGCAALDANDDGSYTAADLPALLVIVDPTPTVTRTGRATATRTRTGSISPGPTDTPGSPTPTGTRSVTPATPTRTPTGPTPTRTPTGPTPTRTRTPTGPTPTRTRTGTSTRTPTITPTPTRTRPVTVTRTAAASGTATRTRTGSRGPTETRTPTGSRTPTGTRTPTATRTVRVNTPTRTVSPTRTGTPTRTSRMSPAPTGTRTATRTRTPTITRTPSRTPLPPTPTRTRTATRTSTLTRTPIRPTETRTPTFTRTLTRTRTPTITRTPTRTPIRSATPTFTPTRDPFATSTPTRPATGPVIVSMGVARADGTVVTQSGTGPGGVPIFMRTLPLSFFIYLEAVPGPSRRRVADRTFNWSPTDPNLLPDMQPWVDRDLGIEPTAEVCDTQAPRLGGVLRLLEPMFGTQDTANRINDLSCRFDGRRDSGSACTLDALHNFKFTNPDPNTILTTVQFCSTAGIGEELRFQRGLTKFCARVRDDQGNYGQPRCMFVSVP